MTPSDYNIDKISPKKYFDAIYILEYYKGDDKDK
jgi:hypothetical protein